MYLFGDTTWKVNKRLSKQYFSKFYWVKITVQKKKSREWSLRSPERGTFLIFLIYFTLLLPISSITLMSLKHFHKVDALIKMMDKKMVEKQIF